MTFIDIRRPERQRRECEPTNLIDTPIIKEAGRAQRHDCFSFKRAPQNTHRHTHRNPCGHEMVGSVFGYSFRFISTIILKMGMQIYVSILQRFTKTNYSKSLSFVFKIEKTINQPTATANGSRGFLTRSVKFSFGQILQFSGWILCWGRRLLLSNLTNWAHYEPRMV